MVSNVEVTVGVYFSLDDKLENVKYALNMHSMYFPIRRVMEGKFEIGLPDLNWWPPVEKYIYKHLRKIPAWTAIRTVDLQDPEEVLKAA